MEGAMHDGRGAHQGKEVSLLNPLPVEGEQY